jgi:hypothetical protein
MTKLGKETHSATYSRRNLSDNKLILAMIPVLITGAVTYFARTRAGSVHQNTPPAPDKPPTPEDKSSSLPAWLQGTAGIVAALGVLVTLLYVAVNSAYAYFYELLGVTPEDVGFDRLAILSRTAGLILPGLILGTLIAAVYHFLPAGKVAFLIVSGILLVIGIAAILAFMFRTSNAWLGLAGILVGFLTILLFLTCAAKMAAKLTRPYLQAAIWGLLVLTLLIGVRTSLIDLVRPRIDQALHGYPVQLIQLIDFQATPARVIWLDSNTKPPPLLRDPGLLYLGRGPRGQVLLACGNVVAVPSNMIIVEDGSHLVPPVDPSARDKFCFRVTGQSPSAP